MTKTQLTDLSQYSAAQLKAELRRREKAKKTKAKKPAARSMSQERGGGTVQQ